MVARGTEGLKAELRENILKSNTNEFMGLALGDQQFSPKNEDQCLSGRGFSFTCSIVINFVFAELSCSVMSDSLQPHGL